MAVEDHRIEVRWRGVHGGSPPRPIKLQLPGWAGHDLNHGDGACAQPWHCPPFVEGSTYGLELLYPFETECRVSVHDGKIHFDGDLSREVDPAVWGGYPFSQFAPYHYGFTSSLDISVPDNMIIRMEPHPRFYTDPEGSCPCMVPGHIQPAFWPRIFFVVFKAPWPGQTHVFRHGEPYGQILILPRRVQYNVKAMDEEEARSRERKDALILECRNEISKNVWTDDRGTHFSDKYRVLQTAFNKGGHAAVDDVIYAAIKEWLPKKAKNINKLAKRKQEKGETPG